MLVKALVFAAILGLAGCRQRGDIRDFGLREAKLPDGTSLRIEDLQNPTDMARGAMFRETLPPDHGLLYSYAQPGNYSFWMYQTKVPLDTIWMDGNRRVLEVVANMPPCPSTSAKQ